MTNKQRVVAIRRARSNLHAADGYRANGIHFREVDKVLNALEKEFLPKPAARPWAGIGSLTKGGQSLLDMSLTHNTDGIPLFPAVDLGWGVGTPIHTPELVTVDTKDTHAAPGEAMYLTGASGLRYWIGHLDRDHPLGTKFSKGVFLGNTVPQARPHCHVGVNAEKFLGKGKQFKFGANGNGPDYTLGAPSIRKQLLALEA